jgi:hypothetical protein
MVLQHSLLRKQEFWEQDRPNAAVVLRSAILVNKRPWRVWFWGTYLVNCIELLNALLFSKRLEHPFIIVFTGRVHNDHRRALLVKSWDHLITELMRTLCLWCYFSLSCDHTTKLPLWGSHFRWWMRAKFAYVRQPFANLVMPHNPFPSASNTHVWSPLSNVFSESLIKCEQSTFLQDEMTRDLSRC